MAEAGAEADETVRDERPVNQVHRIGGQRTLIRIFRCRNCGQRTKQILRAGSGGGGREVAELCPACARAAPSGKA